MNLNNLFLFLLLSVLLAACTEEEPKEKIDYLKLYNEPKYPKKAAGRFLKTIASQFPSVPGEVTMGFEEGKKVEFFYNDRNYVDYFKIYDQQPDTAARLVKVEYNEPGLVARIKYFNLDSTIVSFELFEYNAQRQLTRISTYVLAADLVNYELASYNKFSYGIVDQLAKIDELRYEKSRNFDRPVKDTYLYNDQGNVKEKLNYEYDTQTPYASTEFIYNDKKKPLENMGLPVYEMNFDDFQLAEIFSKNHMIGWQSYSYESSAVKVAVGDTLMFKMVYDSLDYPISKNDSIFYRYIDLK